METDETARTKLLYIILCKLVLERENVVPTSEDEFLKFIEHPSIKEELFIKSVSSKTVYKLNENIIPRLRYSSSNLNYELVFQNHKDTFDYYAFIFKIFLVKKHSISRLIRNDIIEILGSFPVEPFNVLDQKYVNSYNSDNFLPDQILTLASDDHFQRLAYLFFKKLREFYFIEFNDFADDFIFSTLFYIIKCQFRNRRGCIYDLVSTKPYYPFDSSFFINFSFVQLIRQSKIRAIPIFLDISTEFQKYLRVGEFVSKQMSLNALTF